MLISDDSTTAGEPDGLGTARGGAVAEDVIRLDQFNSLPLGEAAEALTACCASRRWVAVVGLSRPYGTADELYRVAAESLDALDWPDILEALAAHPRIGEHAGGPRREAAWSRAEQAAASGADARTAADLADANAAYERKFGYVFLIRAAGRSARQLIAAARERLDHDEPAEQAVVRRELGQIVRLRLDKMLDGLGS